MGLCFSVGVCLIVCFVLVMLLLCLSCWCSLFLMYLHFMRFNVWFDRLLTCIFAWIYYSWFLLGLLFV